MVYSIGFAAIKYEMGYMYIPGYGSKCLWHCPSCCILMPPRSPAGTLAALAKEVSTRHLTALSRRLRRLESRAVSTTPLAAIRL